MLKKVAYILFCITAVLLSLCLSFFSFFDQIKAKYGNTILLILSIVFIICLLADIKKIRQNILDKNDLFLWLYILVLTIGVNFAQNKDIAMGWYFNYTLPIVIIYYLFKMQFSLIKNIDRAIILVCILADIVAIIAILEFIFHRNIIYEKFVEFYNYRYYLAFHRAMSTQLIPPVLGTYFLACIPMALFTIYNSKKYYSRIIGLISVILCTLGIIVTFSRGPILILAALSIIYFYNKNKKIFITSFLCIIITVGLLTFYKPVKYSAWKRLGMQGLTQKADYVHRLSRSLVTIRMLEDHPFIGVGLGHYKLFFSKYYAIDRPGAELRYGKIPNDWKTPDNMHLMMLSEIGVLGYFLFIFFVLMLFIRTCRKHGEFSFLISLSVMGMLFNMLTYDFLYWTVPFYIFWIYCGMLASIASIRKK